MPNILITHVDRYRINSALEWLPNDFRRGASIGPLQRRLRQAVGVEPSAVPPDCVTMNSLVRLRYHATNETRDLRLVYPNATATTNVTADSVSVISPVGAALLGAQVGDSIEWNAPGGPQRGDVIAILYQPEASGDPD